jgi:16S rRNA (cytosine1402-N4)-methyltransferase
MLIRQTHIPVLMHEVLQYLNVNSAPKNAKQGKIYLDVTFGSGGHTRAILEADPTCRVIAVDWDEATLHRFGDPLKEEFGERIQLVWGNFALLYKLVKEHKIPLVDGILADFGTSQVQIAERSGLSLYKDSPLDMRMSPAHQMETAADIINHADERDLADIFFAYGQERWSKRAARAIVEARKQKKIATTADLVTILDRALPDAPGEHIHKATRVFQALRIYVNKELNNIKAFLPVALKQLKVGGRLVCISFHSLEDGLVKDFCREQAMLGAVILLTPKVVRPTEEEVRLNNASRSSRLRAIERC